MDEKQSHSIDQGPLLCNIWEEFYFSHRSQRESIKKYRIIIMGRAYIVLAKSHLTCICMRGDLLSVDQSRLLILCAAF